MTNPMIERVAKAIEAELDVSEMVLTDPMTLRKIRAKRIARAAIAAMREPTENIRKAVHEAIRLGTSADVWGGVEVDADAADEVLRAMIDEALKEE